MKVMKKLMLLPVVFVLILALAIPAFAAGAAGENEGAVTIDNAAPKQTYSLYRIFELDSYNKTEQAYLYKVNSSWERFISQDEISGSGGYVNVDAATGLVTWTRKNAEGQPVGVSEFAEKALAYAKDPAHNITPVSSASSETIGKAGVSVKENTGEKAGTYTITFSKLKLGYYLVDSSMGALCALNTTNPSATMTEKNGQPAVFKEVKEGGNFGDEAAARIGDTVTFRVTVHGAEGAEKYVLHDKMSVGLAFKEIESIEKNPGEAGEDALIQANGDYTLTAAASGAYLADGCSFDLAFSDTVCKDLKAGDTIVVTYTAKLTGDAAVGGADGSTNTNETWLKYGDDNETTHVKVPVHTYGIQLVKTDEGKEGEAGRYNVLTGAEFALYDTENGTAAISLVKMADGIYRIADADNAEDVAAATTVIEAGHPVINGLDAKTYWLEETKAPDGFNKLKNRIKIVVSGNNLIAAGALTAADGNEIYTPGADPIGIQIENHAGGMLPSTGGIGTVIFYILGTILVLSAVVMLIMRSRSLKER